MQFVIARLDQNVREIIHEGDERPAGISLATARSVSQHKSLEQVVISCELFM